MNRPLRLTECSPRNWQPSAAVGADLSRPHIGKYTRNGGQICVFGNVEMHFWEWEYAYLVMWKHMCDNANVRIW